MPISFQEWLKSLQEDLYGRIKKSRRYQNYVDRVICNTGDFYIWKKSDKDSIEEEDDATIITLAPLKPLLISPVSINFKVSGNWRDWYEQGALMDVFLGGICRAVITREEQIFTKTLLQNAKAFAIKDRTFTPENLKEAINHINSFGYSADILLVNPSHLMNLVEVREFIPYWSFRQDYIIGKGPGFIGYLGQFEVFANIGLPKSIGVIYEKRMIKVRKTPLSIKFDDYSSPRILILEEQMYAWSIDDGAMAKIELNL